MQELALAHDHLPKGVEIAHLHWGGGTPTLLNPDLIQRLGTAIREFAPLAKDAQFSVEIDPCEVDQDRTDALADIGMTRASIGVQDFDPAIQRTIGRIQSYEQTQSVVNALRKAKVDSLNIDLLYGLPHQTADSISASVRQVLSLNPDRVALFGYAHVPWMARRQNLIPTEALPTPMERLALYETAAELYLKGGFDQIGIDHFAKPHDGLARAQKLGLLRRNFQGYTEDAHTTLIGFGASAISRFTQGYAQNSPSTSTYQGDIRAGRFATSRGHILSDQDIVRGRLIECLMCDFEVDFQRISDECGVSVASLHDLCAGVDHAFPEVVDLNQDGLSIRPSAHQIVRLVANYLDAYEMAANTHSHAV